MQLGERWDEKGAPISPLTRGTVSITKLCPFLSGGRRIGERLIDEKVEIRIYIIHHDALLPVVSKHLHSYWREGDRGIAII